jgi:exodeoxyribonuclease VII large subunit
MQRLDHTSRRLIHPAARLAQQRDRARALAERLDRAWRVELAGGQRNVATIANRLVRELRLLPPREARVARTAEALRRHGRETLARRAARLEALAQSLAHLNPEAVLTRGYAIVTMRDGAIVHDAAQIAPSDEVALTLARGRALATITRSDSGTPQG